MKYKSGNQEQKGFLTAKCMPFVFTISGRMLHNLIGTVSNLHFMALTQKKATSEIAGYIIEKVEASLLRIDYFNVLS